ncbi:hypothetical protein [Actinophytocola gossypii]|uniref:Uncharacterized protein n=1 Tax=Actinophytocola gossypii TaxID=2812003 RepID=A0ABT2J4R5_9PSEU|nr:hypothetical protein [Actinophytocola gossypii]MCT2582279.1 hypothetical protein [Actinophytocola gossypii]
MAAIEADTEIALPEPEPAAARSQAAAGTVEWNIDRINTPDVWDMGVRGEGVVVAELGRGAQYDHPALVGSYRGTLPDGTFDHEYNWFRPGWLLCDRGPV